MRHARLFATALLSFFIASGIPKVHSADTEQYSNGWPYNLPVDVKFWPEDGPFRRRDLEAPNDEPAWTPVGVRKMSGDEGEKFYMDYWMFDRPGVVGAVRPMLQSPSSNRFLRPRDDAGEDGEEGLQHYDNASIPYNPPLLLHTNEDHHQAPLNPRSPRAAVAALRALQNRAFKCPGGTADCSSIGRPNSCCADGEACQIIPNTGLGDVGCCPVGKGCSGDLKNCDLGFTKCSDDLGGGCCIPDYVCVAVGCGPGPNLISLIIVTPQPTTSSLPPPPTSTSPPTSTLPSPQTSFSCPTAFQPCPASLNGGCCRTDRVCGATDCPASPGASSSPSPTVLPPVRPTTSALYSTVVTGAGCPVGYYQCSAVYHGNCCRIGRDCGLTDCPAPSGPTVVNSNGITIVAPGGSLGAPTTTPATETTPAPAASTTYNNSQPASCASGWYSCDASVSGGCCPSGFQCAIASCTAGAGGAGSVGKLAPSGGVRVKPEWMVVGTAVVVWVLGLVGGI